MNNHDFKWMPNFDMQLYTNTLTSQSTFVYKIRLESNIVLIAVHKYFRKRIKFKLSTIIPRSFERPQTRKFHQKSKDGDHYSLYRYLSIDISNVYHIILQS